MPIYWSAQGYRSPARAKNPVSRKPGAVLKVYLGVNVQDRRRRKGRDSACRATHGELFLDDRI